LHTEALNERVKLSVTPFASLISSGDISGLYLGWHLKSNFCQIYENLANIGDQNKASKSEIWQILGLRV